MLTIAGLSIVATPTRAYAAPGDPFQCTEPTFFAQAGGSSNTQLYTGSYDATGASVWTELGTLQTTDRYNGLAFNPVDGFLYGVIYTTGGASGAGTLVRVDSTGAVTRIGQSNSALGTPPNTLWDSGEFDAAGTYYVASGNAGTSAIQKISGLAGTTAASTTRPVRTTVTLSTSVRIADLTFKDGYLWGANYGQNSTLYRIDVNDVLNTGTAGTVTSYPMPTGMPTSSYGSAFTMTNGNLAFIATNNNMYQVDVTGASTANPSFEVVSTVSAPLNSYSDATNCATALDASLSVTKTGPERVVIGQSIEWDIEVTNDGPGVTSGFVLTDVLPTGLSDITVDSDDSSCVINAAQTRATCNGGRLAMGETALVTVSATAPSTVGPVINSVFVIGNEDPNPDGPTTAETEVVLSTVADVPTSLTDTDIQTFDPTSVQGGTVARDGNELTYTPPVGFSGSDSFGYATSDGTIVTVIVTVVPTAGDDADETDAETPVTVDVLANDVGTGLEVTAAEDGANGTVTFTATGLTYTPSAGFSGEDTFTYTVTDDEGGTAEATVTVTVNNEFVPGDAVADGVTTPQNEEIAIELADVVTTTGSAVDPAGVTVDAEPAHGTVDVDAVTGEVTYTPDAGYTGTDAFDLEVCDASSPVQCTTVTINVNVGANTVTASNDSDTTLANTTVNIDVRDNDDSATGQALANPTIVTGEEPAHGTATVAANGTINYSPAAGFSGTDEFGYQVCDTSTPTAICDTATVTVTITPTATSKSTSTNAEQPATLTAATLLGGSVGSGLEVTSVQSPVNGTVEINSDGNAIFTPADGFSGDGSFTFTLTDDEGQAVTRTIAVVVLPVALDLHLSTTSGTPVTLPFATLNASGIGTNVRWISISGGSPMGAANLSVTPGNDGVIFTPADGFGGEVTFSFTLQDQAGRNTTATIVLTVGPGAANDTATTTANTPVIVTAADLIDGSSGEGLELASVQSPTNGTVGINTDGNAVFTPTTGFSGTGTFEFTLTDDNDATASAIVTVTVRPAAANSTRQTPADVTLTIVAAEIEGLGTGTGLELAGVGSAVNGTVSVNTDGEVEFVPTTGFSGTGSFEYTLTDDEGQDIAGNITVTVTPIAVDDSTTTTAGTAVTVDADALIDNGTGTGLALNNVDNAVNGSVEIDTDGNAVFTPASGFSGTGSFRYWLTDDEDQMVSATVTVTVTPLAADDALTTQANQTLTVDANDIEDLGTGTGLALTSVDSAVNGTVSINADGDVEFVPTANFSGTGSFDYTLTDDEDQDIAATITVTVTPRAANDAVTTPVNETVTVAGSDLVSNGTGTGLEFTGVGNAVNGTVSINTDGDVEFVPTAGFSGTGSFDYTLTDDEGQDVTATVVVTVTPLIDPDTAVTDVDTAVVVNGDDLAANGSGTGLALTGVGSAVNGSVEIDTDGNAVFTPAAGFSGIGSFDYTLTDDEGQDVTSTVTVTVNNVFLPGGAVVDGVATPQNTAITVELGEVLTAEGSAIDATSVTVDSDPTHGTVEIDPITGEITYTPDTGYAGEDAFDLNVCDTSSPAQCTTVTVTVTVSENSVAADDDSATTPVVTPIIVDVLDGDSSASGQALANPTIVAGSEPTNGTAVVLADGTIEYTPAAGFSGTDTFEYEVCDTSTPTPVCDTATVTITVTNVFTPGIAATQDVKTGQNGKAQIPLEDITSVTGAPLNPSSVVIEAAPGHGTVEVDSVTGALTYVPAANYTGTDTFTIAVCDTSNPAQCTTATISVTVAANIVTATNDEAKAKFGEDVVTDVLGNDVVGDGGAALDPSSVTVTVAPENGTVSVNPETGEITYTPNDGFSGTDSYTYQVCDLSTPTPVCSSATVTVTVFGEAAIIDKVIGGSVIGTGLSATGADGVVTLAIFATLVLLAGAALLVVSRRKRGLDAVQQEVA